VCQNPPGICTLYLETFDKAAHSKTGFQLPTGDRQKVLDLSAVKLGHRNFEEMDSFLP